MPKKVSAGQTQIHIRKDALKFAAAHMTIFPDGTKENLHGHNYFVSLDVLFARGANIMLPFVVFKDEIKKICAIWDEKVLLPEQSKFLKTGKPTKGQVEFTLCNKMYSLPADEVEWLAVDNITSESLAQLICEKLYTSLKSKLQKAGATRLSLRVEESPGQGATFHIEV